MNAKKLIIIFILSFIGGFLYELYAQPCYYYHHRPIYRSHYVYRPIRRIQVVERPIHQTVVVKEKPKVVVVEEPSEVVYYHKKAQPKITHVYENDYDSRYYDEDEVITVNESRVEHNDFTFSDMWKQTIWFREDSHKIKFESSKITLDNVSNFLYEYPTATITIYGYASKKHGSYGYNKQLAANRCVEVRNYLIEEYGIPIDRMSIVVRGTDSPEYYIDKWNQSVVIKCN